MKVYAVQGIWKNTKPHPTYYSQKNKEKPNLKCFQFIFSLLSKYFYDYPCNSEIPLLHFLEHQTHIKRKQKFKTEQHTQLKNKTTKTNHQQKTPHKKPTNPQLLTISRLQGVVMKNRYHKRQTACLMSRSCQ